MSKGCLVECYNCKKQIYRTLGQIKNSKTGIFFCCRKCTLNFYNGKTNNSDYRKLGLNYYGEQCELCGYDEDVRLLDVHHIDENRNNNDINNLIVICVMCHAKITRKVCQLVDRLLIYNDKEISTKLNYISDVYYKIYCFDKNNNLVNIFYSIEDIIDWLKQFTPSPNYRYILDCLENKRKSAYSYRFKLLD